MAQQQGVAHVTLADALWSPAPGSHTLRAVVLAVIGSISEAASSRSQPCSCRLQWRHLRQS